MNKIEHLGIAVKDLESANKLYSILFKTGPYKTETVESEGVNTFKHYLPYAEFS